MKRIIAFLAVILFLPVLAVAFQIELFAPEPDFFSGETFVLEIHVFPAHPAQTTVYVENIPQALVLVSSQKEKRSRKAPNFAFEERVPSVVIIQEWKAESPGFFSLGPFIVTYEGKEQVLAPLEIRAHVRDTAGNGEIRWVLPSSEPIHIGNEVSLNLEVRYVYEPTFLDCPAPENALLENLSPSLPATLTNTSEWDRIASFLWTPLFPGEQVLPVARLEYKSRDGSRARVGTRRISTQVLPAAPYGPESRVSEVITLAFTDPVPAASAVDVHESVIPAPDSLRESTVSEVIVAYDEWSAGNYAESLASLRHLEHGVFFPEKYRQIRQEAEAALGFTETMPVPSLPRIQVVFIAFAVSCILLLIVLPVRKRSVIWTTIFRFLVVCMAVCFVVCLVIFFKNTLNPVAVCKSGVLRQIPEKAATEISKIPEGSLAVVLNQISRWCYIQLPSALEGWVEADTLIIYTTEGFYGLW